MIYNTKEFLNEHNDKIFDEFDAHPDPTGDYFDYCKFKYREYLNKKAGELSEIVFHDIDLERLRKLEKLYTKE